MVLIYYFCLGENNDDIQQEGVSGWSNYLYRWTAFN